ncbi:E1A-binding protein p400 [Trichechus manatus latirostris]|uniref:E1A-binding protein p400 n=1 Tax=Trichechus manatus latirostris TaxID=127582 RepID=A0A2Y9RTT2_TRIMA|nr:E1A-binding protein p400 [Trichechus manatus latirostris]
MHHGGGPPSAQHQLQRSRSFTGGSEGEEQQPHPSLPQSPATAFAPSASPSAPQSPGYQIQQLMSRSPVAGQNVNITLQNVGPVVGGNQQITLAPLPLPSPTSPGFQFSAQQRRFEHGSPSYIQVTSPLSQQVQTQSPTQPSPGPGQALPSVRAGASGPGLGLCSTSPTGGFVDASVLVRQISLSPSSGGHFVFQEGAGLSQLAQGTQVQLQHAGTPMGVRERRLSQPHTQSGGTVHHLGPQSPAAGGTSMQPLASPGHLATASLPPQISSLIQGQLMQQQQVLQGQQLSRPLGFERTPGVLLPGVAGSSAFGMTSPPPPTSPSRTSVPPGLSSLPLTSAVGTGVRKAPKKLEEIPPASPEMAQMRKQCLDYHYKEMELLKETFKEYLIELFFLQHFQGNMMDFLAFKKKHYAPLQAYLRQNDLDIEEEEEEEEEEEKSEVINDEVKVVTGKDGQTGTPVAIATQLPPKVSAAFSAQQQPLQQQALAGTLVAAAGNVIDVDPFQRQQALPPAGEQCKRPRLEVGHQGVVFQHPGVNTGVPLQQLMPTAQGGMPPTPQAAQLTGQKQSQQQYDPSTGPPVQNAASLHTPPPQLPARLPPASAPAATPSSALQFSQQPPMVESQTQLQIPVKTQQPPVPVPVPPSSQFPTPLQQPTQPALHVPVPGKAHMQVSQLPSQPQTVALTRPPVDAAQPCQRPLPTSSSTSSLTPVGSAVLGPSPARASPVNRPSSATNKSLSPVASRSPGAAALTPLKAQSPAQNASTSQDSSQDKLAEQMTLENQVQQRVAELRKEGLWSPRRLPKVQEAPRPRAHWDSLLEEMQWMATDFAQERRWKVAAAKKLVRTVARHHEEKKLHEERGRKEEQNRLRRIAASTAREIEYFWSNIEQVKFWILRGIIEVTDCLRAAELTLEPWLPPRLVLTAQAQARLPSGEVVKIAQLASIAGTQNRVTQPETPVTLQFQGNKFTLSHNQLRQLTAGQPLQLQGSVLQIVSAPGQPYLRPPGPVVMQTVSQTGAVHSTLNALGGKPPAGAPAPAPLAPQVGVPGRVAVNPMAAEPGMAPKPASPLGAPTQEERARLLKERLDQLFLVNARRCSRAPVYGRDLLGACSLAMQGGAPRPRSCASSHGKGARPSSSGSDLILTLSQRQESLQDVIDRVACVIPPVVAAPPTLRVARPPSLYSHRMKVFRHCLQEHMAPYFQQLHQATALRLLQFPELRLVQFDSGKLEALAILLQKLKSEGRRVLILSQMVLMLDILEMFLNFHYLTYVRIDENASSEQRQELMRSFNRDKRIFCAILSTHSRSTGVNLVEADTVVFYDNDLNPVMDAKAQEWCDRIGRCKDIHIYRLVSGSSVEEKLLKNGTKDLIREVAAQGNDYSMAFLTQRTIQELFEVYSPMEDTGFPVKAEEFVVLSQEPSATETIAPRIARPFIEALKSIEYLEEDAQKSSEEAASQTGADISSPDGAHPRLEEEPSQLEELADFMEQLTPIEKYALNYLELFHTSIEQGKERTSEVVATASMKEWEAQNAKTLQEREARAHEEAPEEELLTYTRDDAYNMEYIYEDADGQTEIMPLWTPPTPPQDDNDIYIDSVMCLMYEPTPIPESKLPPVYVRKERKRHKTDPSAAGRKKKQRHGEAVVPPRSLFDRATPGLLKMRREGKEQKKNILLKQQTQFAKPLPTFAKPAAESGQDSPEWLISEDWALLQAVKQLLELPLNLTIVSPAHTPNWDLVSDVVNSCSRIYRSSKQCRNRYENVIIPREEGKSKNNRPLRTGQIYAQDENATHTQLYTSHFDLMKMTAGKRSPPIKPLLGMNPFQKNPKHASVLAESGINYDKPLPPIQVASLRAERIAKEKKALADQQKAQQPAVVQPPQQPPPPPQPQQPPPPLPQPQSVASQQPAGQPAVPAQAQPPPQPQPVQPQPKVQPAITTGGGAAVLAGTIKTSVTGTSIPTGTVSGNVIVNTIAGVPAATFQSINKRLASPVAPGALPSSGGPTPAPVVHTQPRAVGSPAAATTDLVSMATTQGVRAVTSVTAPAVVTTNLTPVQAPARSLVTQVSQATGVQLPGKTITPAHFQLLRQQQQQQQQQPQPAPPPSQVQVPQIQAQSPAQIKAVGKLTPEHLIKMQKQKLQLPQQAPPQAQPGPPPPTPQVQAQPPQPTQQQSPQLTTVTAPRPGALLTGTTVANLQVARLTRVPTSQLQAQGQMQAQTPPTAQVALAKPPVVSVPAAVVSSPGVTTLPMNVAGISVAIGQPQKAAGQTVVAQPVHVQQLLKLKQQAVQQQKAIQPQGVQGQAAVQQKITAQQIATQGQQQKVTYATQPALKTQFLTTPISQAPKLAGTQQVQTQIQVAKLPQVVQQQTTVASIQQVAPASQQASPQTVTLTQATAAGQQVQMIPAVTATAQVVQQKLIQQQVVTTASTQLQSPGVPNPAQGPASSDSPSQQPKLQMRVPAVRLKTPTKPPCQ